VRPTSLGDREVKRVKNLTAQRRDDKMAAQVFLVELCGSRSCGTGSARRDYMEESLGALEKGEWG